MAELLRYDIKTGNDREEIKKLPFIKCKMLYIKEHNVKSEKTWEGVLQVTALIHTQKNKRRSYNSTAWNCLAGNLQPLHTANGNVKCAVTV